MCKFVGFFKKTSRKKNYFFFLMIKVHFWWRQKYFFSDLIVIKISIIVKLRIVCHIIVLNKYFKIIALWNCKVRYRLKCVFDHKKRDICETKYMSFCEEKKRTCLNCVVLISHKGFYTILYKVFYDEECDLCFEDFLHWGFHRWLTESTTIIL